MGTYYYLTNRHICYYRLYCIINIISYYIKNNACRHPWQFVPMIMFLTNRTLSQPVQNREPIGVQKRFTGIRWRPPACIGRVGRRRSKD